MFKSWTINYFKIRIEKHGVRQITLQYNNVAAVLYISISVTFSRLTFTSQSQVVLLSVSRASTSEDYLS